MKEKKALLPSTITDVQMAFGGADGKGIGAETDSLAMYITPPPVTDEKHFYLGETPSPPDSGFVTPCSKDSDVDLADPYALPEINEDDDGPAWLDLTCSQRMKHLVVVVFKIVSLTALLYLFICSLGLLSDSFQLVGGKAAGAVFSDSKLLRNPIAGLMIGVLGTVLLQSSSTSTSIVVGLVSSEMLTVQQSIPIVMGANIGTSVTNTIVSVAHSGRRAEFRRAFAGATVHDMFNWLCVIILLPLEIACGYLYHTTGYVVRSLHISGEHKKPPKLLQHLTEPFTMLVVQLDKSKISAVAMGTESTSQEDADSSLIRRNCARLVANTTDQPFEPCKHLFAYLPLSDATLGVILLAVSLVSLVMCLVLIVKLLNTMLRGQVAKAIRKTINNDLPGPFAPLTGYVGIAIGAGMTILIQSSSVFTSTLTPLVAVGVLSLERMYPLTLGANVGTTFTSLLAALASPPARLTSALQISLCHLFFNLTGILLFFVIPITRQAPLGLARILGDKTANYRWFALVYVACMFFLLPGAIFALSMAGESVLMLVGAPICALLVIVIFINILQVKLPRVLPPFLRDWELLPKWMHSLEPADALIVRLSTALPCCERCCPADKSLALGPDDHRSESRHRLLMTATCTPVASIPSRLASRAASPSRFRDTLPNRTVPDTAV